MIEWAEERILRQSPNVFLCVSSFNPHAQKLYERLGYRRVGELPDFVAKGFSEILMRKTRGPLLGFTPGGGTGTVGRVTPCAPCHDDKSGAHGVTRPANEKGEAAASP